MRNRIVLALTLVMALSFGATALAKTPTPGKVMPGVKTASTKETGTKKKVRKNRKVGYRKHRRTRKQRKPVASVGQKKQQAVARR